MKDVILLFGLPESGVEDIARAIHAAGAGLATDHDPAPGRFAVSAGIDTVAGEIDAAFGITAENAGPLVIAQTSLAESRGRIDRAVERFRPQVAAAISAALAGERSGPVVIVAARMASFPRFWLQAFADAGAAVRPILLHRNPIAVAQLARASGRAPRQTVFLWHLSALQTLSAAPGMVEVLRIPDADLTSFGLACPSPPTLTPHARDDADLTRAAIVSDQTRMLDRLLHDWAALGGAARGEAVESLQRRFDDAVTLTGAARIVPVEADDDRRRKVAATVPVARASAPSPLLFHYHIFKNAGTSVDKMLKANFAEAWAEREFATGTPAERHQQVRAFLTERANLMAIASHTAPLPEPELPGRQVFPIIFVRHPLLRVRSAYQFERGQDATTRGAILAKTTDLAGYVTALLAEPKLRHLRNFQTARFAAGTPGRPADELRRALDTAARLPFVGLVEAYDASIERLGELVRPLFPDFRTMALHENVTSRVDASADEKLEALRNELGSPLYERLAAENVHDLELFERVRLTYRNR